MLWELLDGDKVRKSIFSVFFVSEQIFSIFPEQRTRFFASETEQVQVFLRFLAVK